DQRCQSSGLSHIKTPPRATVLEDMVHMDGLSHTSEGLGSQVLALKVALDQAIGRTTDHKRIGCSQSLNSRRHIGGLAQGKLLLSPTTPHFTDHNQPSMYPKSYRQCDPFGWR